MDVQKRERRRAHRARGKERRAWMAFPRRMAGLDRTRMLGLFSEAAYSVQRFLVILPMLLLLWLPCCFDNVVSVRSTISMLIHAPNQYHIAAVVACPWMTKTKNDIESYRNHDVRGFYAHAIQGLYPISLWTTKLSHCTVNKQCCRPSNETLTEETKATYTLNSIGLLMASLAHSSLMPITTTTVSHLIFGCGLI